MNVDKDYIDDSSEYLLLISNATPQGLPHLFSNTLISEIDGTDKEMAVVNANLPNCWHSITPDDVADQRFLLKVRRVVSTYAAWKNIIPLMTQNNDHLQRFCSNAMIGTFPSGVAYDSVRDYLTKGILTPINALMVKYKLPYYLIKLVPMSGGKTCLDANQYKTGNRFHLDILVNDKTLAALKIAKNDILDKNLFWKTGNVIEPVRSGDSPTEEQRWYQISCDSNDLPINIDVPTALPHTTLGNRFQMFYVYADNLETCFVGNNQYRLLTTIPEPSLKSREGKMSYTYRPPYPIYFPMESRIHRSVHIEIKDDNDKPIYFEWGVTSFLLHVRTTKSV